MDGKPIEDVKVLFAPLDRGEDGEQGPVAFAVTDPKGHYTLAHRGGGHGAAVGRNQVWLTTRQTKKMKNAAGKTKVVEVKEELIPPKYNTATELVVDIPVEGMTNADFDLKSSE